MTIWYEDTNNVVSGDAVTMVSGDSLYVAPNVQVAGLGGGNGVTSAGGINDAEIYGSIYGYYGIATSDGSNNIYVGVSGSVSGRYGGMHLSGTYNYVSNAGDIAGRRGVYFFSGSNTIANSGTISSSYYAAIAMTGGGNQIINSGTILAPGYGAITIESLGSDPLNMIDNSGTISGGRGYNAISTGDTGTAITNSGHIRGTIVFGGGNDSLSNQGTISGNVYFGTGNNSLSNQGTISGDLYFGNGDDSLNNKGTIRGDVVFGDGTILYDGTLGSVTGTVFAGTGTNTFYGGGGNDRFFLGAALLTAADQIDGGAGKDTLWLEGDYSAGLTFTPEMMVNVEVLLLSGGSSYTLTTDDDNVAAGQILTVNATYLVAGDVLIFDGSAETDGRFTFNGGAGNDKLTGGAGNDTFNLGAALTAADKIDGGAGTDTLKLNGDYSAGVTFNSTTVKNVENIVLAAGHSYTLKTNNATVAAGQTLTINGSALGASDVLTFSGAAETDGHFIIIGGMGADKLTGGALSDTFGYASAAQSTSTLYDTITGFNFASDIFDTPGAAGTITAIDAKVTSGNLSTASFDTDLASAMSGHLGAHHAILFKPNGGTLSGQTFLVVDFNGTAGYQASADLVIRMISTSGTLAAGGFH